MAGGARARRNQAQSQQAAQQRAQAGRSEQINTYNGRSPRAWKAAVIRSARGDSRCSGNGCSRLRPPC
jgi:hypothetical protein